MSDIENEDRPDFLLEKFTSTEEQARAYAEAEREMQRMRSEIERERTQFADALSNLEGIRTEDTPPQRPYSPDTDPLLQNYQQALDMGDARALLAINLELNRQMTQEAIREGMRELTGRVEKQGEVDREVAITLATERVSRRYDDWEELAPEVGRVLQENPEWIPSASSVEAYERVIGQAARIVNADKVLANQDRNEQIRQQKLDSQGLTGQSARVISPEESAKAWDQIKNAQLTGYAGILRGSG